MKVTLGLTSPRIISGFPGIGKSWLKTNSNLRVSDSDSSQWSKDGFPANYLAHIQALYLAGNTDIILVSSHDAVRQGLVDLGLTYILVYPSIDCKQEYLKRYADRGSPQAFIDMMDKNWESFIEGCANQEACHKIELQAGEFLSDSDILSRRC